MRRGEIWTGAGTGYASRPRPVVIVQDDLFTATDSVIVCLLTSDDDDAPLARVAVPADAVSGLDRPSWVQVDKITAIRRIKITRHVGRLTPAQLAEVEQRIVVLLGIAR